MKQKLSMFEKRFYIEGEVLTDNNSGRKIVLDEIGLDFFNIHLKSPNNDIAIQQIVELYNVDLKTAKNDFEEFLDELYQKNNCVGSILPGIDHVVLEPTSSCNGGCPHCYHSYHGNTWSREQKMSILSTLNDRNIKSVSITGGEVFSKHYIEEFFELVENLNELNINIGSISTNATFITEQLAGRIKNKIRKSTVFRISLDALESDLLARVRPGYKALEDPYFPIKILDNLGFPLVFTTNIFRQESSSILNIAEYLRRFKNIQSWNLRMAVPVHPGESGWSKRTQGNFDNRPSPDFQLDKYKAILFAHSENPYQYEIRLGNYLSTFFLVHPQSLPFFDGQDHPCREDKILMTIKSDGIITQCPILSELEPSLTMDYNIFDTSDDYKSHLPLSPLNIWEMECKSCKFLTVCGGGCRLYSMAYNNDLLGCDLTAFELWNWIYEDNDDIFSRLWPAFHKKVKNTILENEGFIKP